MTYREPDCVPKRSSKIIELPHRHDTNRLLAATNTLPPSQREALLSRLQLVHLQSGHVLCEPGDYFDHIYLPTTTILSLQYVLSDGMMLEGAQVGSEGLFGQNLTGNNSATPYRAVACRDGFSYRLDADVFVEALSGSVQLRNLMLSCIQFQTAQIAQVSFCSRHHLLKKQLCRWLILAYDRSRSVEIKVTHNMLAQMLGVWRETISDAASELQKMGLIHQHRSSIILADLHGLDAQACGCHKSIRQELNRIFPDNVRAAMGLRLGEHHSG
ncbi:MULTISPECIES: Crp/Fnr family transcriptional regulator [Paraburkholderia]|uniref:CRP-like cAMP-binding protein n=2 Tax=Paraburkholderia TaxID=1822464 RepID=A0A7Z0BBA5_9BURK|nr:Crp/Fnr family transcriptional regulator [Paraburkholderia bryophila]NYH27168.1 CRP-like cAMP-binding protein [Paraburkholderia bryophila]